MEIFKVEEFNQMENPNPGVSISQDILTDKQKAKDLGGKFGLLVPGSRVPYHFHVKRESVIIGISGEAIEVVDGEEIPIKANEILFIATGEKHGTVNKTDKDFRYLAFFTAPPDKADFIEVK